jgi:hypothetical protein
MSRHRRKWVNEPWKTSARTASELDRERVEKMLGHGCVVCCLDDALEAEPKIREPDLETGAAA